MNRREVTTIGRREFVDLPELDSVHIESKVDTGAYRSVIHCNSCHEVESGGNVFLEATFDLDGRGEKKILFKNFMERTVRNSSGQIELRFVILTLLKIGNRKIRAEVSLTDRSDMRCQVLIGRRTLGGKYLVDVRKRFLIEE
ncbi:MAG: RimK/LysX family protein [Flavobacteriales bacterium]|nr:RimK/LysX family protein [Flavobacteriales bacterium]